MNEATPPDQDILLSFLRNELDAEAEQALLHRLRAEPALRQELRWLQEAAGEAFADRYTERGDASFKQLQQRMRTSRPAVATAMPWQRWREWWSAHAGLLQGALATVVLMQAVALVSLWQRYEAMPASMYRGGGESCLTVTLRFRADVREVQIASWLSQYDASITNGPDAEGRYRVRLEDANTLRDFMYAPEGRTLVDDMKLPAGCPRG